MKFPSRFPCRLRLSFGAAFALASAQVAIACGPDFPNSYYDQPATEILRAPEGVFAREIARLVAEIHEPLKAVRATRSVAALESLDLRRALGERGVAEEVVVDIAGGYETSRGELEEWISRASAGAQTQEHAGAEREVPARAFSELDARVPAEFAGYFRGAAAWHRGAWAEAGEAWRHVLELPAEQRRYRSTWASFMLGRLRQKQAEGKWGDGQAAELGEARAFFQQVRELAAAGFPDPLGLASESLGWEARAALDLGRPAEALELYLRQHAAGDDSALASLRIAARRALHLEAAQLRAVAEEPRARRVVTACVISRLPTWESEGEAPEIEHARDWAVALRAAGVREVEEAERLAWVAYEAGQFPLAWEWIALAREDRPETAWLRAKLALRSGDLQGGEKFLVAALAAEGLSDGQRRRLAAELSRVRLARDDFAGALAAALTGGHWEDAAFVAERVMSAEELTTFVEARPVPDVAGAGRGEERGGRENLDLALRELLARRLARRGRAEQAAKFFGPERAAVFLAYAADVRTGFDGDATAEVRAAAFWRAAQAVHEHGMELLGTELEPDWAIWGGDFALTPAGVRRTDVKEGDAPGVFSPSELERARLQEQRAPEKRFQYRYRAAELALWAASLLPNDSEQTAAILSEAGGWLKRRDPEAAQRFYQALVIRCGRTPLGREAAKVHWFPKAATAPAASADGT